MVGIAYNCLRMGELTMKLIWSRIKIHRINLPQNCVFSRRILSNSNAFHVNYGRLIFRLSWSTHEQMWHRLWHSLSNPQLYCHRNKTKCNLSFNVTVFVLNTHTKTISTSICIWCGGMMFERLRLVTLLAQFLALKKIHTKAFKVCNHSPRVYSLCTMLF